MSEANKYLNPDVIAQTLNLVFEDTKTYFYGEEVKNAAQLDKMISREYSAVKNIEEIKRMCNACLESLVQYQVYTADSVGDLARDILGFLEETT